jgi:hypothetical protein
VASSEDTQDKFGMTTLGDLPIWNNWRVWTISEFHGPAYNCF